MQHRTAITAKGTRGFIRPDNMRVWVGPERKRLGMGAERFRIVQMQDAKRPWGFVLEDADGATVYKSPGFRTREQARVVAETMVGWELPTP